MKKLLTVALLSAGLVGCAQDSKQSTLVGSWTKVSATGQDCDGADSSFVETRTFSENGMTSDGSTTVKYSQGSLVNKHLNGRVYSNLTLNFNNQERMVTYSGDSQMLLQADSVKECFYSYKKN